METVGSSQAQTRLARLLKRVEHGESFTITRRGKPIATLVPVRLTTKRASVGEVIARMARLQDEEGPTLGSTRSVRALMNVGRL